MKYTSGRAIIGAMRNMVRMRKGRASSLLKQCVKNVTKTARSFVDGSEKMANKNSKKMVDNCSVRSFKDGQQKWQGIKVTSGMTRGARRTIGATMIRTKATRTSRHALLSIPHQLRSLPCNQF